MTTDTMQTDQINELAGALALAQGEIRGAIKGRENPFFKSSYATLADVWDACREPLSKNGIAVIQSPQKSDAGLYLDTTLVHKSGQWVRSRYPVSPVKNDPQGIGSAITYARRYALAALVGIVAVDEDDDGEASMGRDTRPAPRGNGPSPAQQAGEKKKAAAAAAAPATNGKAEVGSLVIASLTKMLEEAQDLAELKEVGAKISKEPKATQEALRSAYMSRKEALSNRDEGREVEV